MNKYQKLAYKCVKQDKILYPDLQLSFKQLIKIELSVFKDFNNYEKDIDYYYNLKTDVIIHYLLPNILKKFKELYKNINNVYYIFFKFMYTILNINNVNKFLSF